MEACSISAERSLVSLNMTCSPSLESDCDTKNVLTYSYLTHAKISF